MSTNISIISKKDKILKNLHRHFIFDNENVIQDILSKENGIWQHPLIKSNKKCLICLDEIEIFTNHIRVNKLIFFKERRIKLKPKHNFNDRILNRHINSDSELDYTDQGKQICLITDTDSTVKENLREEEKLIPEHKKKLIRKVEIDVNKKEQDNKNEKIHLEIPSRSTPFTLFDISMGNEIIELKKHPEQINPFKEKERNIERDHIINILDPNSSQPDLILPKQSSINKIDYCDICFGDIKNKFILSCGDFYCKECIKSHVIACLENITLFKNLRCPKTICNDKIRETDIEKLFNTEEFQKYLKFKAKIEGFSDNSKIPCPIPDCEGFGKKSEIRNSNVKCSNNHTFCVKCLKETHYNKKCTYTCDYAMQIMTLFREIKKCPNCKTLVEKQEGCNNVTCGNIWCNFTFCWVCMNSYDKNHYSNPLSPCFGMQELQPNSRFAKHKCLRISKCLLIFILMLVILPIIILLFSFFVLVFYILAFVMDGSAVKNLKLKTERKQKFFKFLIYSIYSWISIASIPLGYWTLFVLILSSPFIYLVKKFKNDDNE